MVENPWRRLPDCPPFVLPEDEAVVHAFNAKAREAHWLRVDELLPEPFVGDPNAPLVILGNNPGFTPEGAARKKESRFAARMRANLIHESSDCPFVFYAEDVHHGNRRWWDRKLRAFLHLGHATIATSILAVEHFPYPSRKYGAERLRLPSGAQDYNFSLVHRAMARKALIVLTRGTRRWLRDVPGLREYTGLCVLHNPQTASISRGNCDRFHEIARAMGAA